MSEILTSRRLTLRFFRPEDAPAVEALAGNWEVARMVGRIPHPYPPGAAAPWIAAQAERRAQGREHVYAIAGETLIGAIGLSREAGLAAGEMELGYWLGEPFWGRGYATEAGARMLEFAFDALRLETLRAGHFVDNPASGRVLQKLGFRYSGEETRWCLARAQEVPCRVMRLERAQWADGRAEGKALRAFR